MVSRRLRGVVQRRHRHFGHQFSGRCEALVVDAASPGYLRTVCEYVYLNPVRAKLLTSEPLVQEDLNSRRAPIRPRLPAWAVPGIVHLSCRKN